MVGLDVVGPAKPGDFIVTADSKVMTRHLGPDILSGITRAAVLRLCAEAPTAFPSMLTTGNTKLVALVMKASFA